MSEEKVKNNIAYLKLPNQKVVRKVLCKVQTREKQGSCGERFCSLLFQYNRNKMNNQALIRQPVSEKYLKLGVDNTPITPFPRPLLGDVHHRQIQHLQQAVIGREHGF